MEVLLREQCYSLIVFLDMFKEIDRLKFKLPEINNLLSKYPQNQSADLRIEEVVYKLNCCEDLVEKLSSKI